MKAKLTASFLVFLSVNVFGQHIDIFPTLSGEELLDSLVAKYKPIPLNQSTARDILFGEIYNVDDSLTCVYAGSTIYLDPSLDPTQAAFNSPAQINTEHTYPKSLGADGIGEGDMHHLYPTRSDVNAQRGNLPFGEVPDATAESWYYLAQETSSIPTSNIDLYSERGGGMFEPPEAHKGNVARAMMYFYTMYEPQANAADPTFFPLQRQTLCDWHLLDPIDGAEWSRTWGIASYQQEKPNPYVVDCTLPERTFCEEFGQSCTPVNAREVQVPTPFLFDKIQPNPVQGEAIFHYVLAQNGIVRFEVYDLYGRKVDVAYLGIQTVGEHQFHWEESKDLKAGVYVVNMFYGEEGNLSHLAQKMIVVGDN